MYFHMYTRYASSVNTKWKPFELTRKHYPCPGCKLHKHPRAKYLFNNYYGRGRQAYMLYWKTHPSEYKQIFGQEP